MTRGDQTRQTILDVALKEASMLGLEGLAIGPLAKRVGMSKSGLFAHFGSKEELQVAVVEHAAELFGDWVLRPTLKDPRGEPRLQGLVERYIAWTDAPPVPGGCLLLAGAFEMDARPGPVRDAIAARVLMLRQFITRAAQIAIEEGHFGADADPDQLAFEIHTLLFGYHVDHHFLQRKGARARAMTTLDSIFKAARRPS